MNGSWRRRMASKSLTHWRMYNINSMVPYNIFPINQLPCLDHFYEYILNETSESVIQNVMNTQ